MEWPKPAKPTRAQAIDQRLAEVFDHYETSAAGATANFRERFDQCLRSGEWITIRKKVNRHGTIETESFKIEVPW